MRKFIVTVDDNTDEEMLQDILNTKRVKETKDYEKAFNILYEYFDSIADEEKPKVSKKLARLGI